MSKVSKTARASSGLVVKEKVVTPDHVLVQRYRENRAAHLWPALEQSDALLRTLDTQLAKDASTLALCNQHLSSTYTDLDDAVRQVLQAMISFRDLVREEKAVPHGAGAGAHSGNGGPDNSEPGLSTSQGLSSIGD